MRTFEITLLIADLGAILFCTRKGSQAQWFSIAGVLLLGLFLQGSLEGLRYQMAPAYLLSLVLLAHAIVRASGRFPEIRTPPVVSGIAVCLSLVLITLNAFLATSFPVFSISHPTGNEAVGIRYFHLVDDTRADPFRDKQPQRRELMVKVFYPATPDNSQPLSRYFNGSSRLLRAYAAFYQMPEFLFDHLKQIQIPARDNLELSETQQRYPVILFSHGAGATMEVSASQSVDLASHGYIVVNIDHTYVSAATEFPDRIVTAREATTDFHTPEPAAPITQIMAEDIQFVLRKLSELDADRANPVFRGRLDLQAVGVIGHSVGGAAAYNLAIHDPRIKAAINLDGAVYITPKNSRTIAPFLMLANDRYHLQAIQKRGSLMKTYGSTPEEEQEMRNMYGSRAGYEAARSLAQQNMRGLAAVLQASGTLYTIAGSDHMKFTDIGLFIGNPWLRNLLQISGATDPAHCLEITQALTVAFYDHHLKGQSVERLTALPAAYPELKHVDLNETGSGLTGSR